MMPRSARSLWVDEAKYLRLYAKLDEVLGTEAALTLMELLCPERFESSATATLREVAER
jgi:hypothetical protein